MTTATARLDLPTSLRMALGALICAACLFGAMFIEGGSLRDVTQLTCAMMVAGGCVAGAMAFRFKGNARVKRLRLDAMARGALMIGVVSGIMGLIGVMKNLDHPDEIGPGIAVAVVAPLYSAIAWLVLKAEQHRRMVTVQQRQNDLAQPLESLELPLMAFVAYMILMFSTIVVLYAIQVACHK